MNKITGKIIIISKIKSTASKDGSKTFLSRELVLDTTRIDQYTGQRGYESFAAFEFQGDKCRILDGYMVGMIVTVSFDVRSMKYSDKETGEEKFFTRVVGFAVELRNGNMAQEEKKPTNVSSRVEPKKENDILPF